MNWKLHNIDIDVHFQVDSESCQISNIKLFMKTFHGFKPLTIYAKGSIEMFGKILNTSLLTIRKVEKLKKWEVEIDSMYK